MREPIVTEITRRAMATEFAVLLPGEAKQQTEPALDALDLLDDLERRLTVFRPDSEVSRLNAAAGKSPRRISRLLMGLLQQAQRWSELSDGAFDITAGPLIQCWGFTQKRGKKPTRQEIAAALARVDYRKVVLDPANQTACLTEPGMSINLGAIGKGFAVDQIAAHLRAEGLEHFLVHGGKSTIVTAQPHPLPATLDPPTWKIGVEHPLRPTTRVAELEVTSAAIATTSSGKQFFHHRGKRYGHVIDPRSGQPAGDWLSLTLVCDSATEADALSTAYYVLGREETRKRLAAGGDHSAAAAGAPSAITTVRQAIGVRALAADEGDCQVERISAAVAARAHR